MKKNVMWPIDHFLKPLFSTSCRDGRPRMGHTMDQRHIFVKKSVLSVITVQNEGIVGSITIK